MAVSEINDMGHDVFFPWSDRNIKAYAYREGSGTKLELERCWSTEEMMVKVAIVDHPNWRGVQCSRSHERSSIATSRQCWWKFRGVAT